MNKIEVKVLHEGHHNPEGMMMFLAKLTQRGHNISDMKDLVNMYDDCVGKTNWKTSGNVAQMPHGTIKRFTPVTIAIVGASRRFLAQIRTHSIGLTFVSASLQYSDYSGNHDFVVPYNILKKQIENKDYLIGGQRPIDWYLGSCKAAMDDYELLINEGIDNDSAGYVAPQGLRNILVISGNHEAWDSLINKRSCRRNTDETAYVAALIWEALYETTGGQAFFKFSGPDCMRGQCREGHMTCGEPYNHLIGIDGNPGTEFIKDTWPLLEVKNNV